MWYSHLPGCPHRRGLRDDTHAEVLSGFGNAGHDGLGVPADIRVILFEAAEAVVAGVSGVWRVLAEVVHILPQTRQSGSSRSPAAAAAGPVALLAGCPLGISSPPGLLWVMRNSLVRALATVQQEGRGASSWLARPSW